MSRAWVLVVAVAACATACATAGQDPDAPASIDGANEPDGAIDAAPLDGAPDACAPTAELCNGVNDDCDTGTDENFPTLGQTCSAGVGACLASGMIVCDGLGTDVTCTAVPGMPVPEQCNSIDDDCDTNFD